MKTGFKILLVAVALLLVIPAASFAQQYGKQSGTVTDVDGKPLAGVMVKCGRDTIKTGDNGKFTFTQLRAGGHIFMFAFEGYQPKQIQKAVNPGLNNRPIKVQLEKIKLSPAQQAAALAQEGLQLFQSRKVNEALAKFNAALELNPGDINLHYYAGICLSQTGKYDEALKHLLPVLEKAPNNPQVTMIVADDYFFQEKFKESLPYYEKLVALGQADDSAYLNMGIAYQRTDADDKAVEAFNKVVALKPDNADAYMRLGAIHAKNKNAEGTAAALEKFFTLKPNAPELKDLKPVLAEALLQVATKLFEDGDKAGAKAAYEKIIKFAPDTDQAESAKAGLEVIGQ